jgi:hypothetical protein
MAQAQAQVLYGGKRLVLNRGFNKAKRLGVFCFLTVCHYRCLHHMPVDLIWL